MPTGKVRAGIIPALAERFTQAEREKAIEAFEFEMASALIRAANYGIDPAALAVGFALPQIEQLGFSGAQALRDALKSHPQHADLPVVNEIVAQAGGNPKGMLSRIRERPSGNPQALLEMLFGGEREEGEGLGGMGFVLPSPKRTLN